VNPKHLQFEDLARAIIATHPGNLNGILEIRKRTNLTVPEARELAEYVKAKPATPKAAALDIHFTPAQVEEKAAINACNTIKPSGSQTNFDVKIARIQELRKNIPGIGLVAGKLLIERATGASQPPISDFVRYNTDCSAPVLGFESTNGAELLPSLTPTQIEENEALAVCEQVQPAAGQTPQSIKIPRIKELRTRIPRLGLAESKTLIERATGEVEPGITKHILMAPFQLDGETLFDLNASLWPSPTSWKELLQEDKDRYHAVAEQIDALYRNRVATKGTFDPFEL
jgi:ribosomal protein L7/L12